jgi:hypothetical protein
MGYDKALRCLEARVASQTKRLPGMAAFAVVEVGFAEGALAIVAGHAALRACVWKMLCREGRSDLASLLDSSRADGVATLAVEILAGAVIHVAEAYAERACCRRGLHGASRPVTRAAS